MEEFFFVYGSSAVFAQTDQSAGVALFSLPCFQYLNRRLHYMLCKQQQSIHILGQEQLKQPETHLHRLG